jgi:hypothetical protein
MFVFDNVSDKDARSYGYELYESNQVSGSYPNIVPITSATIYSSGTSGANVFTVGVANSTDSTTKRYFGRIRTIDSSGNPSDWSPIVQSDQENPLISNQYISSLTAAKITAGTIGAHEIILTQAGSATSYTAPANTAVIRSSNYQANTAGWLIRGDGFAEFDSTVIRGTLKAGAVYINQDNRWKADANGNVISTAEFKVGNSTKNLYWDGTNLTFTGNLSAAGGTFSGNLSAAGGTFTGEVTIGSGSYIAKIDANGLYLGSSTFASAPFKVSPIGALTANNVQITGGSLNIGANTFSVSSSGYLRATAGKIAGWEILNNSLYAGDFAGVMYVGGDAGPVTPSTYLGGGSPTGEVSIAAPIAPGQDASAHYNGYYTLWARRTNEVIDFRMSAAADGMVYQYGSQKFEFRVISGAPYIVIDGTQYQLTIGGGSSSGGGSTGGTGGGGGSGEVEEAPACSCVNSGIPYAAPNIGCSNSVSPPSGGCFGMYQGRACTPDPCTGCDCPAEFLYCSGPACV